MTTAINDIIAERERQIKQEGFTAEHDDKHDQSQLSEINNWALKIVSREISRKDFKPIHLQDSKLIKPVVNTCGLDLFDFQKEASA